MPPDDTAGPAAGSPPVSGGPPGARWQKAACSGPENGGCVEIAGGLSSATGIRDSLRPHEGTHFISKAAFAAFLADAKAGAYDLELRPAPGLTADHE